MEVGSRRSGVGVRSAGVRWGARSCEVGVRDAWVGLG